VCVRARVCVCVRPYLCMYTYVCVCMYVCMNIHTYVCMFYVRTLASVGRNRVHDMAGATGARRGSRKARRCKFPARRCRSRFRGARFRRGRDRQQQKDLVQAGCQHRALFLLFHAGARPRGQGVSSSVLRVVSCRPAAARPPRRARLPGAREPFKGASVLGKDRCSAARASCRRRPGLRHEHCRPRAELSDQLCTRAGLAWHRPRPCAPPLRIAPHPKDAPPQAAPLHVHNLANVELRCLAFDSLACARLQTQAQVSR